MPLDSTTADFTHKNSRKAWFSWLSWAASGVVAFCFGVVILEHHLLEDFCYSAGNVACIGAIASGLCPAVWWLWVRFVGERLEGYSRRTQVAWHAAALVSGGVLVVVIPVSSPYSWADAVGMGFVVLVASAWLATRPELKADAKVSRWAWLWYALPPALYWSYYLWVFWPALISYDSVVLWNQMAMGHYADEHPAFYTFFNWILTRAWHSPAAVAFVQIVLLSLVIGWSLAWMRRHGMPRWLAMVACGLLAFAPANGLLVISIWKDIPYSTALVALVVMLLAIVRTDGRWLEERFSWLWLALPAIVVYLSRHNGFPIVVAVFFALPVFYWRHWRRISAACAVCMFCIVMVKGPIYRMKDVQPVSDRLKAAPLLHYLAAHVAAGTPLKPEEKAVLDDIMPLSEGKTWPYDAISVMPTLEAPGLDKEAISRHLPQLPRLLCSLTYRNPKAIFDHIKNTSRVMWQVRVSPMTLAAADFKEHQALRLDPALLDQRVATAKFEYSPVTRSAPPGMERTYLDDIPRLAWRPALMMYLFFAGCVAAGLRARTWKYALVALPVVVQTLVMAPLAMSPDFRYHWGVYMLGILVSGYMLFTTPRQETERLGLGEGDLAGESRLGRPHWPEEDGRRQSMKKMGEMVG